MLCCVFGDTHAHTDTHKRARSPSSSCWFGSTAPFALSRVPFHLLYGVCLLSYFPFSRVKLFPLAFDRNRFRVYQGAHTPIRSGSAGAVSTLPNSKRCVDDMLVNGAQITLVHEEAAKASPRKLARMGFKIQPQVAGRAAVTPVSQNSTSKMIPTPSGGTKDRKKFRRQIMAQVAEETTDKIQRHQDLTRLDEEQGFESELAVDDAMNGEEGEDGEEGEEGDEGEEEEEGDENDEEADEEAEDDVDDADADNVDEGGAETATQADESAVPCEAEPVAAASTAATAMSVDGEVPADVEQSAVVDDAGAL
jgi:hypothetical protein